MRLCIWKRTHSAADWSSFKSLRNQYHKLILSSKKEYYSSLISSASNKSKRLWQQTQQTPTPQILLTASHHFSWHLTCRQLCFFSLAKYPSSAFLSPATLPHHLRTHPFLLPLPLIFQSSPLPQNPKSTRSSPTVQTSNLTQVRSPPGFLKNVHPSLFPQSPILSTSPSSPASFILLSRNPLSHHCLRNQHWIKKNYRTISQSRICLSFPR